MEVPRAIETRQSTRAFLPDPVPREIIEDILNVARFAPSGSNIQPWQVYVCAGAVKDRICAEAIEAFRAGDTHKEWAYYSDPLPEPYLSRRRATGWGLYGLLGIQKGDRAASAKQHARNYQFFDAPVGLFFFIDGFLELGSWLDYGMYIQNIMLMARHHGLHTCSQASWPDLHRVVRRHLPVEDGQKLVCGMSMGYADPDAVVNTFRPDREPSATYTRFLGFGDSN